MIKKSTRDAILSILKASLRINKRLYEILKTYEVSEQQFNVLRVLRGQKNKPSTLKTIQARMVHKMSNTSRLIDKLIVKGYVTRNICETNRRKIPKMKNASFKKCMDPPAAILRINHEQCLGDICPTLYKHVICLRMHTEKHWHGVSEMSRIVPATP